ncbi:MAG: flagellar hook-associated protein FlgL [Burkholderiaceae bacterium]
MRISTANAYNQSIDALQDRQTALVKANEQMTTGKRVNRAGDDPAAAARAERALASVARVTASQRAVDASNNAVTLTEGALGDAEELLQQAREQLVAAGNATYGDSNRAILADHLSAIRNQLFAVANRADGAGNYLFAGQATDQRPFVDAAGGVQYQGGDGAALAGSGETLPLNMDGQGPWMRARTGNGVFETRAVTATGAAWIDSGRVTNPSALTASTYSIQFSVAAGVTTYSVLKDGLATAQTNVAFTPGQSQSIQVDGMSAGITGAPANGDAFELRPASSSLSVFDTLDRAIADLKTPLRSNTQIAQSNSSNLSNLDAVLGQVGSGRAQMGTALNRIEGVTGRLSAQKLASQTERTNAESLDLTEAISDFSNQQTGYDAALKAYSMVQRLSLFNYVSP